MRFSYWSFQAQIRSTKFFASEVMSRLILLFLQSAFDHGLGGDSGVIGARHPKRFIALHALRANHDVLQRVVQSVAEVQRTGHVGRRDHDRERLSIGFTSAWPHSASSQALEIRAAAVA